MQKTHNFKYIRMKHTMTINEKIHTILSYKEISLITIGLNLLIESHKEGEKPDEELIKKMERLSNRLGDEMYAYPKFDHTKKKKERISYVGLFKEKKLVVLFDDWWEAGKYADENIKEDTQLYSFENVSNVKAFIKRSLGTKLIKKL